MRVPFLFAFLLLAFSGSTQNSCIDLLQAAYSKMEKPIPEDKSLCAYFEYDVTTFSKPPKNSNIPLVSKVNYKIWSSKKAIIIKSDLVDIYKDNKFTVTVNKLAKIITISHSVSPVTDDQKHIGIRTFREDLISRSVLTTYEKKQGFPEITIIEFTMHEKAKFVSTIRKLKFEINNKSQDLLKLNIYFISERQDAIQINYRFLNTDYEADASIFKKDIVDHVMYKNKTLLPEFNGYELTDLR